MSEIKVGIITFHKAHNYGAVLQAYALKKVVSSFGVDVGFIDYQHEKLRQGYSLYPKKPSVLSISAYISYVKSWIHLCLDYKRKRNRHQSFVQFIDENIPLILIKKSIKLDSLIMGSDQIWNFKYTLGIDENYYGINSNIVTSNKISYAASMGVAKFAPQDESKFVEYIGKLNFIGVREEGLKRYIESLGISNVQINLDPTLLLDKNDWNCLLDGATIKESKPYILVYQVQPHNNTNKIVDFICKLLGMRAVFLSSKTNFRVDKKHITVASPNDFIYLFKNASFVITTSFHGTVFSLINEKPFITLKFDNEIDLRSKSILCKLDLEKRLISNIEDIKNMGDLSVDYSFQRIKLNELREESIVFLKKALFKNE